MSFLLSLTFPNPLNESIQVGDIVYYTPIIQTGGASSFHHNPNHNASSVVKLGKILNIVDNDLTSIITILDNLDSPPGSGAADPALLPGVNDFIMFGKDKSVNTTSLVGYYAEVKFENNSTEKVELFSVGSEITESSK